MASVQRNNFLKRHFACLAFVGGFLESFAMVNRNGLFANAQTANFTRLWLSIAEGKLLSVLYYIIPLLLYISAIIIATVMPMVLKKFSWPKICLIIEIGCILLLGVLPENLNYEYAILPIFFCTALQYQTFVSCNGFPASSLFVTNNLRQASSSLTLYIAKKDKYQLMKFKVYLFIIVCFAIGVISALVTSSLLSDRSVLICIIPLTAVFIML